MTSTVKRRASFSPELFTFLRELRENNDRDWFKANKRRYEEVVQEPALQFIADFAPGLRQISPHLVADPRPVGGSLFRIYRDTRFSKDKAPYKTHSGIHFRHDLARDVHAPVFYLHLAPGDVFAAAGVWRPDTQILGKIRETIVADPERWRQTTQGEGFTGLFRLGGDALKRGPAGCDSDHPLLDDLKRKDFIAVVPLSEQAATAPGFLDEFSGVCRAAAPFMRYLCDAIEVPF